MATLDATVGGIAANSYVSGVAADDYFEGRLNAGAWSADASLQDAALMTATERLEQERYKGAKANPVQRLKWPRTGIVDDDKQTVSDTTIPKEVREATFELALEFLRQGTTDTTAPTGLEQFKDVSVGPVSITMRDGDASQDAVAGDPAYTDAVKRENLPPQVQRLLRPFLTTDQPIAFSLPGFSRLSRA